MKGLKRNHLVLLSIFLLLILITPLLQGLFISAPNPENEFSLNLYEARPSSDNVWARWYRIYGQSVGMIVGNNGITLLGNEVSKVVVETSINPFTMKIDYDGDLLWSKIYYGEENYSYSFNTVIPLSNGYYLAAGNIKNKTENVGVFIIKFDGNGNPVWGKGYYSEENTSLNFIVKLDNGDYIGGGLLGNKSKSGWLFSMDAQGNLLWSKCYSMGGSTSFRSALPLQKDIIVAGEVRNGSETFLFLTRVNFSGEVIWCRKYVDIISDTKIILKSVQNQIWVFATISKNNGDIIFLKLNGEGRVIESKRYGTFEEEQIGDVAVIDDAAVILGTSMHEERVPFTGNVTYVRNISNLLLFKIEGTGEILWQHLYYLGESFYGVSIFQANNGYYFAANDKDFLPEFGRWRVPAVFKVDKYGGIGFLRNSSMEMREINLENSNMNVSMKDEGYSSGLQILEVRNISFRAKDTDISSVHLSDGYSSPLPPTNLSASIRGGKIYICWKSPVDNGGLNITSYRIYRSEDGKEFVKISETKNTTYVDAVEKGRKYEYYVTAVNSIGESEKSNIVKVYVSAKAAPEEWISAPIVIGVVVVASFIYLKKKIKDA
ncbi:MAG: fibronectin type III domain-containing protein [Palaeococcus sp.]|uniref:fibronectin type III domain-containing protein n=1 Tax=Palaeococcus sp. (in: euryarchaeotes) TaxID=2820298 RepID=UPI0025E3E7FE|nr:fibronectin type III domain-containing protein [Palaeococcus sp. (in: euryarchaeotes)]MCD6559419.1 fibronectin type III domain-containing protein [Palaeococcus sp. (in: euryarchaeotes)]